jgi:hypothetical protein
MVGATRQATQNARTAADLAPTIPCSIHERGGVIGRRARESDEFEVRGVVERLARYDVALADRVSGPHGVEGELVERAATLLQLMPGNQRRATIEDLVCPDDWLRGRRAVDALIDAAFALEDDSGRLRRLCVNSEEGGKARAAYPSVPSPPSVLAEKRAAKTAARPDAERRATWLQHATRFARLVASSER